MSINANVERAKEDYDRAFEAGRKSEYDAFWDAFQANGNRVQYVCAFAYSSTGVSGGGWHDTNYNPKYEIKGVTFGLQEAFRNNGSITDTKVPLRLRGNNLQTTFNYCTKLKRIPCLSIEVVLTTINTAAFAQCTSLEELHIECVGDGCIAGNNLTFRDCTKLNKPSIVSVINALSTTTSGLTVTFSKTAVNKAFETTEGANDGSTSAEWLALVATRSNWTIALA